jgi:hypothetical protein
MIKIVKDTIKELKYLGVNATLSNVVITRLGPWTLSYVKYEDGTTGLGCANNEAELANAVPDDVAFINDLINLNAYDAIDELGSLEENVFINSLITSIVSALSYKLINDKETLKREGYDAEACETPPLLEPSKFVKRSDVVAFVGFHVTAVPLCAEIAKEVLVTELMDLKKLSIVDFNPQDSNIKIFSASKNEEVLSRADVVYITGETVVNGTISELLEFSKNARMRIVYGPTSAFYPKALFENGVDILLPVIFPNTLDFKRRFVLSRGWWYSMKGVKLLLIKRRGC